MKAGRRSLFWCARAHRSQVIYEWIAEDRPPVGIPSAEPDGLRNRGGRIATIRVDNKVVQKSDALDGAKSDEVACPARSTPKAGTAAGNSRWSAGWRRARGDSPRRAPPTFRRAAPERARSTSFEDIRVMQH